MQQISPYFFFARYVWIDLLVAVVDWIFLDLSICQSHMFHMYPDFQCHSHDIVFSKRLTSGAEAIPLKVFLVPFSVTLSFK